ncbi:hypothetical protein HN836_04215, partial [Candidatus Woesearchaeota archaeon]|nr:hypothetical protein [Candidatus Woesearchaeota archaeon]
MRVFEKVIEANLIKLKRLGYDSIQTKTQYEKFRYKGDTTITLYTSGKLTIAGKKENEEKAVKFLIAEKIIKIIKQDYEYDFDSNDIYIGCDESLKGDTFGGICLSIFCANKKIRKDL